MVVVILVEDSYFREHVAHAVNNVDNTAQLVEHKFCSTLEELEAFGAHKIKKIVLDLEHPQALVILQRYGTRIIAVGPYSEELFHGIKRTFGAITYSRSHLIKEIHNIL